MIYMFVWRWCIDKLGVFHANQTSMRLDPHLNQGWGWRRETGLSPPVDVFILTVSRRFFFCGSFLLVMLFSVLCFSCSRVCSLLPFGHLLGKDWPLGSFWNVYCIFVIFHVESWVKCDTWLYRFLMPVLLL